MSIWAIADIHASATEPDSGRPTKPMDIFGAQWANHVKRLEAAWEAQVEPADTVIIAGDTEWALRLEDAMETLLRIHSWKGRKILLRGNHDYWWSSKTTSKVRKVLPGSISLLHNNAFRAEGFNICGAKGSPVPGGIDWTEENARLLNRETQRLGISLGQRDPSLRTIVALHYPPFYPSHRTSPYRELLDQNEVSACVYGHLHGGKGGGPIGTYGNIEYRLVAADSVGFRPVLIATEGEIVATTTVEVRMERENVTEKKVSTDDLKELAQAAMQDKTMEVGDEEQSAELWDVPTESAETLTEQQGG